MPNIPSYQAPSNPAQALQEEQDRAAGIPQARYEDTPQNTQKLGLVGSMGKFMNSKTGKIIGRVFAPGLSDSPAWKAVEKKTLGNKYDSIVHGTPMPGEGQIPGYAAQQTGTTPDMNALTMKYKNQLGY